MPTDIVEHEKSQLSAQDRIDAFLKKCENQDLASNEIRVFGPPGTGKTTYLSKQVARAVDKHGSDSLLVASYTRTAAAQLVMQDLNVPRDFIGTLHALCYRAMGSPTVAETKVDEFNKAYPQYRLSASSGVSMDECLADAPYDTEADRMFAEYRLQRARRMPITDLHHMTVQFARAWEEWKIETGYVDFADMIEKTMQRDLPPPGEKKIGIYDEVQDFNALELALIRQWSKHQDYVILAGDDDQALYGFAGASTNAFLFPQIPPEQKRILSQSYRVPRAVQRYADAWIKQVQKREPKEYKPRDFEGEIRQIGARHSNPLYVMTDAQKYLDAGKTVMLLASCGYMLNSFKQFFRSEGIPFHNPYRKNRGDWNPLGTFGLQQRDQKYFAKDRLLAFLESDDVPTDGEHAYWKIPQLALWVGCISAAGIIKRGAKTKIADQAEFQTIHSPEEIIKFHKECFEEHALKAALARDLQWFRRNIAASKLASMEFPIRVLERRGREALIKKPQIIISTIHGVKGGEADACYVFPDLSVQGMREWNSLGDGRDSVIRLFYVAMTRAKESLVLCEPVSNLAVKL